MSDPRRADARPWFREDPDGFMYTHVDGDLSEDMARALAAACRRINESGREVVMICDARRMGTVPAPTRKAMAEGFRPVRFIAIAVFGASFTVRVISTLAMKSIQIVNRQAYPVEFFATEAEARAWLVAQRDARSAGQRPVA
ncbi:STAS/SEC14 domain-containing protein [Sorangium sp. So ce1097]|uniref:STAS/SEC14 domain-containing protein n=1 Tax=Sorangium sp. So ce1097 TaxID=3133330 RepID=UPI003F60CFD0